MVIEQIIEFELKGRGPLSRTCTPKTGYFHNKTNISKANLWLIIICCEKYCRRKCTLLSQSGSSHLQNFTSHCKILSVFWTWSVNISTFYSSSCLRQKTVKKPFSLQVKLPPAHLSTTRGEGFIHTVFLFAERQAEKLWIPIFILIGLTRPGIKPQSIVSVETLYPLDHWLVKREMNFFSIGFN